MKLPGRQVGLNNLRDSTIRHSERSEESLLNFVSAKRGIPRFARNDGVRVFFHNLLKPQASRYLLALSIALALLSAFISASRTTHAQSSNGATPRASTDVRPVKIHRCADGDWGTKF